LRTSCAFSNLV